MVEPGSRPKLLLGAWLFHFRQERRERIVNRQGIRGYDEA